jgi:hypothetical protein
VPCEQAKKRRIRNKKSSERRKVQWRERLGG